MLEEERIKEVNALDMMQNTGIIYNPQAIIETQIITTLGIYIYQVNYAGFDLNYHDGTSMDPDKKLHTIILALLIEHVTSYFIAFFRQYDIEQNGELDIQGVPQAKRESAIANIQYLFVCLIVGFSVKQMFILDARERRHQSYLV